MEVKKLNNSSFKRIRKFLNLNQTEFAEKLGTHQQVIAMIENNRRDVSKNIRLTFYNLYGVSYEAACQCQTEEELNKLLNTGITAETNFKTEHITPVKFYKDAKAAAGLGQVLPEVSEEEIIYFDTRYLENIIGIKAENAIIIQAKGNSMDSGFNKVDDIKDGDLLLVDTSIKEVINNKIFVIQQENELRVKRLIKEFNGDVYLISNNEKEYPPELVSKSSNIIGRVMWNGSKELV